MHTDSNKLRILLVEDNPGDVFLIKEHLLGDEAEQQTTQYNITDVSRIEDAIHQLETVHYDLVLLDMGLPDSQGVATVAHLKGVARVTLPVIVLTGLKDESVAKQAIQLYAQDYLLKANLSSDILQRSIRYAMERHRLQKDVQQAITASPSGMMIINQAHDILFVNPAVSSILQTPTDALLQQSFDVDIQPNETQELHTKHDRYIKISCHNVQWQGQTETLLSLVDITAEKHEKLSAEHRQRLESLGILAGGIAHDFNNILSVIMGHTSLAAKLLTEDSPLSRHLKHIENGALKATDLCKQMLDYSGQGQFVVKALQLNPLIEDMADLLHVSIDKKVQLNFNLSADSPIVEADISQLQQVIMNLIINASESIGHEVGKVTLTTGIMDVDATLLSDTWLDDDLPAGQYAYMEVMDSGSGMDTETMKKIFDPFFTTKFSGRGLGMSAVLGIVRGHKGALQLRSTLDQGTQVRVLLPISKMPVLTDEIPILKTAQQGFLATILVIDDEPAVLEVTMMMLESLGFHVLCAADGVQGLEQYRQHKDDIAAVLLDMTMPKMDGGQVFSAIKEIEPTAQVILTSGYSEQESTHTFSEKSLAGFLQKPYNIEQLQELMLQVTGP